QRRPPPSRGRSVERGARDLRRDTREPQLDRVAPDGGLEGLDDERGEVGVDVDLEGAGRGLDGELGLVEGVAAGARDLEDLVRAHENARVVLAETTGEDAQPGLLLADLEVGPVLVPRREGSEGRDEQDEADGGAEARERDGGDLDRPGD